MVFSSIGFGGLFLLFFMFIPVTIAWVWSIFDNFIRNDHSGWAKVVWFVALVALPIVGTLIYVVARPVQDDYESERSHYAAQPSVTAPTVGTEMERLSDLHERGILSDAEYGDQKERLLT